MTNEFTTNQKVTKHITIPEIKGGADITGTVIAIDGDRVQVAWTTYTTKGQITRKSWNKASSLKAGTN